MADGTRVRPGNWPPGPFLSHDELIAAPPAKTDSDDSVPAPKPPTPIPGPRKPVDPDPEPEDDDGDDPDDDGDADSSRFRLKKPEWWSVKKTDGDEPDNDGDEPDNEKPEGDAPTGGADGSEQQPQKQSGGFRNDGESWFAALARHASDAKRDKVLARRRVLAAKWAVGAAIGYGFNLDQYVTDGLAFTENDPGTVFFGGFFLGGAYVMWKALGKAERWLQPSLKSVGDIISSFGQIIGIVPVLGPLVNIVTNLFHAVFTNYIPFRVLVTAAGGWLAAPWGYVAVGRAQANGLDMTQFAPHAVGLTVAAGTWFLIERRTEAWCEHWPGTAAHVVSHLPTGTILLATALYQVS